ncbi:MAG: BMC domain-containing protein [Anaerolineales bacterium]|nr:MAG: BMC domain-containing protein [Anaerolineales bacterium]
MDPALALIEFNSIATGIQAGDAMVKKAPIAAIKAGTVQPGKYLVLITGQVAEVDESLRTGMEWGGESVIDTVFLPQVHPAVVQAIAGDRVEGAGVALGVIETIDVASTIQAADAGVKGAQVTLREIRLADGLGGKAFCLFQGEVQDVEAAVEIGVSSLPEPGVLVNQVVIPQLHPEMGENLLVSSYFGERLGRQKGW